MGGTLSLITGAEGQLHLQALLGNAAALQVMATRSGEYSVFDDPLIAHIDSKTADGVTALMICAAFDHIAAAKVLLRKGCNPNITDKFGSSALIHAATAGHASFVRLLLAAESGAVNVNLENAFGANALVSAAFCGQLEVVTILLEEGKSSTAPTVLTKTTALHAAAYTGRLELVKLLLSKGVKDSRDSTGCSAFMLAELKEHTEIADLLREVRKPPVEKRLEDSNMGDLVDDDHNRNPESFLGRMRQPLKAGQWHDAVADK